MRQKDREAGLETGPRVTAAEARRIGEKLLFVDELEDTLEQVRSNGEPAERIQALERRLSHERETIQALQSRGSLRYDEIARVMEAIDRSG
ncbi:MAG TPA: hypothetical protein VF167_00780 [Longimicrobiaceae bacterium]